MLKELCISCNKRPVHVKKYQLCKLCYSRAYTKDNLVSARENAVEKNVAISGRELNFIKNFFTHKNWFYSPTTFQLDHERYTPDFYDGERNVFIEVSGTKQAYHLNKHKYVLFEELYPKIKFEIRTPDGELLKKDKSGRCVWDNNLKQGE